jgi:hypothetical protein
MTMKKLFLGLTLLLSTFLSGCKTTELPLAENPNVVNVYSEEGKFIVSISEESAASKIRQAIETCEVTYVKVLPLYKHYIELIVNDEKQIWLVSSRGYIKRKDVKSNKMYRVNNPEVFAEYLK